MRMRMQVEYSYLLVLRTVAQTIKLSNLIWFLGFSGIAIWNALGIELIVVNSKQSMASADPNQHLSHKPLLIKREENERNRKLTG